VCAAAGLIGFAILKAYGTSPHRADEGIYFYDALRLSEGARLYRDLFFAHPPLHLLLPTVLVALFGYSFALLKLLPALAGAAQGVLTFFIGRRAFHSDLAGCVAALALWFGEDFLKSSSYLTGMNQAGALWCAALLALLHRRWGLGGALAAASSMTLLQTAVIGVGLGALALLEGRRELLRYVIAFAAFVAAIHALCVAWSGTAFFDQVYLYHLNKEGGGGGKVFSTLISDNLTLFVTGGVCLVLSGLDRRERPRRLLRLLAALGVAHAAAMISRPIAFPFYFQPLFVMLALACGWALSRVAALPDRRAAAALAAVALLGPSLLRVPLTALVSSKRSEQLATYARHYPWRDAPALGVLNGAVRALIWRDDRVPGEWTSGALEFLWNQSRAFDSYDALVRAVDAATASSDTVFGDSGTMPLVALGAHRRITADFADTNVQRFSSGTTDETTLVATLEAAPPKLVLAGQGGCFVMPTLRAWLDRHYVVSGAYADVDGAQLTLYTRR
jgi:hypothetical protein